MKLSTISQSVKNFFSKIRALSPATKKTAAIAAICALFFILGLLIPSRHDYTPQPTHANDIAMWKDSIDKAQKTQQTLQIKLKKSEADADELRKTLYRQKTDYNNELARIRTLPPDLLYKMFATATGGIDTAAVKAYRIPTANIMQADIIFAQRDYLLKDTTTKYELINALGTQVNLLHGVVAASDAELRATVVQRDTYKSDAIAQAALVKDQTKLIKKEQNKTKWTKIGWVTSEIATILLFIAL